MDYELKDLAADEAEKITKELQEVLAKYDCEMGTSTTINIFKRVPKEAEPVLSPIQDVRPDDTTKDATDNPAPETA